jgi:O-antigen/teichoic acid export membrane protein
VKPRQPVRWTLARNTVTGWLAHSVNVASTLYLTPYIIHGLGVSGYGLWILITQLTGYSGVLDLGVRFTLTKQIAQANIDGDRQRVSQLISTALAITACAAVLVLALAVVCSFFFGRWFGLSALDVDRGVRALLVASLTTAIGFPAGVFMAALAGHQRYDLLDALGIASQVVRTIGSIVALDHGGGIVSIAVVNMAASVVAYVGSILLLFRRTGRLGLGLTGVSRSVLSLLTSFGLYAFASTAGWYLIYATDLTLIGAILSPVDVAHYGLAANILVVVTAAIGAFTRSLVPIAGELTARNDAAATQRVYLIATRTTLLIGLPCLAALALAGPALLSIWVGSDLSRASGVLLRVLALAYLPIITNSAGQALALAATSRGRFVLFILLEGVTNLGISFLLVQSAGPVGVAIGTLIPAIIFQGVLWPRHLTSQFGISIGRYWREALRPTLLPLGLSVVAFGLVSAVTATTCRFCVFLPIIALALTFFAVAFFSCLSLEERFAWANRLRKIVSTVRGA